jgi:polyisoprenoid-binding protein YceI
MQRCNRKPAQAAAGAPTIAAMSPCRVRMPNAPLQPKVVALLLAAGWIAPCARAAPEHFVIDPVHTRIAFRVAHLGLSQSIGTFSGANGTLDFDPDDWRGAKLDVSIALDRLDMGDAKWKAKVLSDSFLDAATQPVAHFVATAVEPLDRTHAKVTGTLSLRGHESTVVLDVALNGLKRSVYTVFHKTAGFSATTTLHRKDLGMDAYPDAVGEDVAIDIEAEASAHAAADPSASSKATQGEPR